MIHVNPTARESAERAFGVLEDSFNSLLAGAPVMAAAFYLEDRWLSANPRVLETLGYISDELLRQPQVNIMTRECHVRYLTDVKPLFWRVGCNRGSLVQLFKKDGQVTDLITDNAVSPVAVANVPRSYGVAYDPNDLAEWQQASTLMMALQQITQTQHVLQDIIIEKDVDAPYTGDPAALRPSDLPFQVGKAEKALGELAKTCQGVTLNLKGTDRIHEQSLESLKKQLQELLQLVKGMENSLAGLSAVMALLTDSSLPEFLQAISGLGGGEVSLHPAITRNLVHQLNQLSVIVPHQEPLTERETQVLKLIAGELSNKEIAETLFVTDQTAGKHISNILDKLQLSNRTQAALYALQKGLASLNPG